MEDEGLVVAFVSQLEVGTVGIHSVPEVRPERQVLGRKEGLSLDRIESAASVQAENFVSDEGSSKARYQTRDGNGDSPEGEDGEGESARGLFRILRTTYPRNPAKALPVTLRCSRLRFSAWILCLSAYSR